MAKVHGIKKRAEPAEQVETWPLGEIVPYDRNPRTHPDHQIELLATLMTKHGVDQPIVVDEAGVVIKGHGRLLAARKAGLQSFPVVVQRGKTEAEKRAMRINDNQVSLLAGWDQDLLRMEVGELRLAGWEIPTLGFSNLQMDRLFLESTSDAEKVPEPSAHPIVCRGDLWMLGEHRLLCGDATSAEDVWRLLAGAKPHLMVTDPPYGVDYDPEWRNKVKRSDGRVIGAAALGKVANDDQADWIRAWRLFDGDVGYIWHAGRRAAETALALVSCGFFLRAQIIWRKSHTIIGCGDYHYNHEPCWYVVREGKTGHWTGARDQGTVWDIAHDPNNTGHGTQKPVECMRRPIENNSVRGDYIYDPFVGSGTTIIAAEMMGRKCLALDIDEAYAQVAIERWQQFTGRQALLDGISFGRIAASRKKKAPPKRGQKLVSE